MTKLEFLREKQRQCIMLARSPSAYQPAVSALESIAADLGAKADAAERQEGEVALPEDDDAETFDGGWTAVMGRRYA